MNSRTAWIFLLTGLVWAQTYTATVRGIVTDASGAVVPGATVTLTNTEQNRPYTFSTNQAGEYALVQVPPGSYTLSVKATGFKSYQRSGLTLEVAQVAAIDVVMEVGAVTEAIDVTAQAPLLETASSTLGEVVNSKTTEALPLNGRNVMQLVALTPGINQTRSSREATSASGSIPSNGFSANGGRNVSNEVMLDGSPQVVMGYNQPAFVPSPDALQEFKVQTNNLSAEYGRTGGAVVNLVHRSGTSQFHGVLYEFLRNDKFDANGFFNNRNRKTKPPFRFNQFGFTLGGPLTPSRSSTFFFLNYEGVRQVDPGSATFSLPTPRMKAGNFGEIANIIYDPATINAAGQRQPFASNIIPAERFNPVAVKILGYYPNPALPGVVNNFFSQIGSHSVTNTFTTKIDRRISDRQNLFGRFSWSDLDQQVANHYGNAASPNEGFSGLRERSITVDDSYILGKWVIHGNYGYAYSSNPRDSNFEGFDLAGLGLPQSFKSAAQFAIFPRVSPAGYGDLGNDPAWIIGNKFETHTFTGDATRLIGGHTVKLGGTYRLNKVSNFRPSSPAGNFTFNEGWTRQTFNGNVGGNSIASMLLGLMNTGVLQQEPNLALQVRYGGAYFQDDWRVNTRLTVNAGLRWDTDRPLTERWNRTSWFDFNAVSPLKVPGLAPLTGGLVFAGRNGTPRGNKDPDNNNFAPRFGMAYKLSDRLVVRSGFGIFFNPTTGIGPGTGSVGALSFNAITNVTTSIDGGRTPFTTLSNPFANGYNQPTNGADGLLTFVGQSINAQFRRDRVPYSMQWNADIQYELPNSMLLDVAYAGNSGVKLLAQSQLNQVPDQYLALGDGLTRAVPNPFLGILPATSAIGQATVTQAQLLRPYPFLTGLQQTWGSFGHSSYHALQVKFRKRYRNGLQMLVAYTWSKMLDDFSSVAGFLGQQNPGFTNNNKRFLDKSLSTTDTPQRLVVNYEYDLPFGSGRKFLNRKGIVNVLAGGWSANGIASFQSGVPIAVSSVTDTTNSLGGVQRPDRTGLPAETPGAVGARIDNYLDRNAFAVPARFTFGNSGRLLPDARNPGLAIWDLSVLKLIPIHEKRRLEFRAEFFNIFNHVNFASLPEGNTVFGRPQFGTVTDAERARIIQLGMKFIW
ncbi:MAG TPA: TonB-dependent receptor [Bryobacteraceae bacterium]|nr:TonB-dependent receptor [Bryobacteraceae bacterium]